MHSDISPLIVMEALPLFTVVPPIVVAVVLEPLSSRLGTTPLVTGDVVGVPPPLGGGIRPSPPGG